MDGSTEWRGPSDLLALFSIDQASPGALSWSFLVLYAATARRLGEPASLDGIARGMMRRDKLSPVIWWGRIKRTLAPILAADPATLAALGLTPERMTGRALALAAADHQAAVPGWEPGRLLVDGLWDILGKEVEHIADGRT